VPSLAPVKRIHIHRQQAFPGSGDNGQVGLGIFFHLPMITSGSVVALFLPLGTSFTSGCLPGLLQSGFPQAQPPFSGHQMENTSHPRPAYFKASSRRVILQVALYDCCLEYRYFAETTLNWCSCDFPALHESDDVFEGVTNRSPHLNIRQTTPPMPVVPQGLQSPARNSGDLLLIDVTLLLMLHWAPPELR
jgi:hypothetical protein